MKEKVQGVDPIANGEDHTNGGANTKSPRDPAQSGGRSVGEGQGRMAHRHAGQESDSGVVPMKGSNQGGQPTAESLEGKLARPGA